MSLGQIFCLVPATLDQRGEHGKVASDRAGLSLPGLVASQHLCTPHEWSLGFSSLSVLVVLQTAKGACLLFMGPLDWDAVCSSACSLPRVSVHLCDFHFPLSPLPGAQGLTQSLFFLSYPITCVFFDSLCCIGVLLPISSSFCIRIVPHVGLFLIYLEGKVNSMSSYLDILISFPA